MDDLKLLFRSPGKFRRMLIDRRNRKRLTNHTPTLICSNCLGGLMYHWLGLEFNSPFINLWMTGRDFLTAMENFDDFLAGGLTQVADSPYDYPVGEGILGIRVMFMHYSSWDEAMTKWNERIRRIDRGNMAVIWSNFHGLDTVSPGDDDRDMLLRFDRLPFRNKIVFVDHEVPYCRSAVRLKGYHPQRGKNVFSPAFPSLSRYIDQFDYVSFLNRLKSR